MFESARIKLTAWYLLIIMLISVFFSIAFYHAGTREIERIINRIEFRHENPNLPMPERFPRLNFPSPLSLADLENAKKQLIITLIIINSGIFFVSGTAGYFLAGRTLRPIRLMMDEQNQFISNASHEFRTPIATLRAEMEGSLMEKNISDKRARELISSNLEELGTLQELSNKLLRVAQLHDGNGAKYTEDVFIRKTIEEAQKKVSLLAQRKQIIFETKVDDVLIKGNKESLVELFVILLDNAIKYSPLKKKVSIKSEINPSKVCIVIKDQGLGIAKEDIPYIFDRFFRADKSRFDVDGYGLGLSIAKRIIETHNGDIQVISRVNKGTTFSIEFPLKNTV